MSGLVVNNNMVFMITRVCYYGDLIGCNFLYLEDMGIFLTIFGKKRANINSLNSTLTYTLTGSSTVRSVS